MIIPLGDSNYGVSIIRKQAKKLSLHLVSTFTKEGMPLKTKDFEKCDESNRKVILEKVDEGFLFANPLVTDNAVKVFEFLIEAKEFVKRH